MQIHISDVNGFSVTFEQNGATRTGVFFYIQALYFSNIIDMLKEHLGQNLKVATKMYMYLSV